MVHNKLHTVRVWDLPTRLFHWLLAAGVSGLLVTGLLGGALMNLHFKFGFAVLALLLFRIIWGFVGGLWSRFSSWTLRPGAIADYLAGRGSVLAGVGHSPLGTLSVVAIFAVLFMQAGSGLMSDDEIAFAGPLTSLVSNATVSLATSYHKQVGKWLVLGLVALHLLAIAFYAWRKNSLIRPMVNGNKHLDVNAPSSRDDWKTRILALLILGVCSWAIFKLAALASPSF